MDAALVKSSPMPASKIGLIWLFFGNERWSTVLTFLDMLFLRQIRFLIVEAANKQNCTICGRQCPDAVYEPSENTQPFILWCNICKREVVLPYVFADGTSTGDTYKKMQR